jgi:hypothetical protein
MPLWRFARTVEQQVLHDRLTREFLAAGYSPRISVALADGGHDLATARRADDRELLRLPNFGRASLRKLRARQGGQ